MFGNKLNCWNTIPILDRAARRCRSPAGTNLPFLISWENGWPLTRTSPESIFSSVIRIRSMVVFPPDPLGPINATRSPRSIAMSR